VSSNQALSDLFSGLSRVATAAIYFYNLSYMRKPRIAGLLLPPLATREQQTTAPNITLPHFCRASQYLRLDGADGEKGQ
jgi:hypothetical protein